LGNKEFWDQDLNSIPDLTESIATALNLIETSGVEAGFKEFESSAVSAGKT
jgi:tagaturonate reductase